ncbi:N-acetylmuramic acid 6-phosphate etherase [Pontibacillus salipaludis]|uniref:N-acetylmuramic acid 6-phosphate etherase n=1 Tax=Pontibacillus salipaludis TaxID=1697394 RepID=A0ABQ1QDX5_9BACI|nr:N-acetylmuramic acid 6-phosphate etherase [Pontibacillus salipaludis]GGD22985.1 N-acetylmuramic acid 6-phosphate etherase [Pontibacillus salipaludis]
MIQNLTTETRNQHTMDLDDMSTHDFLKVMNEEDHKVPQAVEQEISSIEKAVNLVVKSFQSGGRLIYIGAGTSGRLGILDAVECPPTFGTSFEKVRGLIAGGERAIMKAVEGAEDNNELAAEDLKKLGLTKNDTVVGLAASGRTPYVKGGLAYAKDIGAHSVAVSCNKGAEISQFADVSIEVMVGPEVITGSTRLKSGTAQKLVVNMISTGAMVGIGKVYGNLMVDVQLTNHKLVERAKNIIALATGVPYETAEEYLKRSGSKPKVAIVMIEKQCDKDEAEASLEAANGFVRHAIN